MQLRTLAVGSVAVALSVILFACEGSILDVGTGNDASSTGGDASTASDGPTTSQVFELTLDDVPCSVTPTASENNPAWPSWTSKVSAECAGVGILLTIESNATIAYPQSCSVATKLTLYRSDGDGGAIEHLANNAVGSCTLESGPSTAAPSTNIELTGVVVRTGDPSRSHRVRYREGLGGSIPVDAGYDGDASRPAPIGRPTAVTCSRPQPRPVSNPGAISGGPGATYECELDSECAAKPNGRCNELREEAWYGGDSLGTRCTYDVCASDSDCAAGAACGCNVGFAGQNVCLPQGNCRVDADCGAGRVCGFSRSTVLNEPGVIVSGDETGGGASVPAEGLGYFCTTAQDECVPGETKPGNGERCAYGTALSRWIWAYQP